MKCVSQILSTALLGLGTLMLLCSVSEAKNVKVTCPSKTIQSAIAKLKPGDVLLVSGSCSETVDVPANISRITIDGQGTASLNGTDPAGGAIQIRGRDITVKNLTVTSLGSGIQVHRGGTALIDGVTIDGVGGSGILINGSSFARIVNSTIENNGDGNGISITENSSARIGFLTNNDTIASPNTITGNNRGISVSESSSATIVGNDISNNTLDGILVNTVSHADIASNTINGNGAHGINFGRNSGVDLGADSGTGIFESPNSTTVNNGGFGLRCFINSYADRRLGSLNGTSGPKDFPAGCADSTDP
jgi:parallel beta-helix repeat protein